MKCFITKKFRKIFPFLLCPKITCFFKYNEQNRYLVFKLLGRNTRRIKVVSCPREDRTHTEHYVSSNNFPSEPQSISISKNAFMCV